MLRFGYLAMVGSFVAFSLFACGDKINPKGKAQTGGSTDSIDGSVSEAGTGIDGTTTIVVTYSKTIAPMMAASCAFSGCHWGSSPALGIGLDSYANLKFNLSLANTAIQDGTMPISPGAALTAADKKNFQDWVNAGALNN